MTFSVMHFVGGVIIGLAVGRLFATFTLRKVKGGKFTFMGAGILGSFLADFSFRIGYGLGLVSEFFYKQTTIVVEMIVGALLVCYLLNLLGKKERIEF